MKGDWSANPSPPFIPGHEGYGEVVELGEELDRGAVDGPVVLDFA